jgi:hypothetical protein
MMPQLFLRIRSRGPHLARDAASDATSAAANNGSPFWLMLAMQQAMLQVMQQSMGIFEMPQGMLLEMPQEMLQIPATSQ